MYHVIIWFLFKEYFRLNLILFQFSYLYFRDPPREERRQVKAKSSRKLSLLINLGVSCLLLCYNTTDVFSIFVNEWRSFALPSDREGHNYYVILVENWDFIFPASKSASTKIRRTPIVPFFFLLFLYFFAIIVYMYVYVDVKYLFNLYQSWLRE